MTTQVWRKRLYPSDSDISEDSKALAEDAFAGWLGEEWLERPGGKHPLQTLWKRLDPVAAMEVFTIGDAVRKFRTPDNEDWFAQVGKAIKSNASKCSDYLFRLVLASAMSNEWHQPRLAPYSEPGFDILLPINENKAVRISCKNIGISDAERRFRRAASEVHSRFLRVIGELHLTAVQCVGWFSSAELPPQGIIENGIRSALAATRLQNPAFINGPDWWIGLGRLTSDRDGWELSASHTSYNFTLVAKYHQEDELERFENRFREAARKFKKHCPPTERMANVVALRLPESISTDRAQEWLSHSFAQSTYSSVSGVLLYRYLLTHTDGSCPHCEFRWIPNPNAVIPLNDFLPKGWIWHIQIMFGRVSDVPAMRRLCLGDNDLEINDAYLYAAGHLHYVHPFEAGIEFSLEGPPYSRITHILRDSTGASVAIEVRHPSPPDFQFL